MIRVNLVWVVLLAHTLTIVVCPAETVLCRTSNGSVQVEVSLNGLCSKQLHESPRGPARPTGADSELQPCLVTGRHGACCDTLLSTRDDATCSKALPLSADHAVGVISDAGDGGIVVARVAFVTELLVPPWQHPDLDMLRTVRLLT